MCGVCIVVPCFVLFGVGVMWLSNFCVCNVYVLLLFVLTGVCFCVLLCFVLCVVGVVLLCVFGLL